MKYIFLDVFAEAVAKLRRITTLVYSGCICDIHTDVPCKLEANVCCRLIRVHFTTGGVQGQPCRDCLNTCVDN